MSRLARLMSNNSEKVYLDKPVTTFAERVPSIQELCLSKSNIEKAKSLAMGDVSLVLPSNHQLLLISVINAMPRFSRSRTSLLEEYSELKKLKFNSLEEIARWRKEWIRFGTWLHFMNITKQNGGTSEKK